MKLGDVLILSAALALVVIGIHQSLTVGIGGSYSIFMFAVGLLFWFQLRRNKAAEEENDPPQSPNRKKKK
jgi:Flp pilus assembly protein TadB